MNIAIFSAKKYDREFLNAANGSLHDGIGIENPTGTANPIHDNTDQYRMFGYSSYIIDETSRFVLITSGYHGDFDIPNNPGQTPEFTDMIGGLLRRWQVPLARRWWSSQSSRVDCLAQTVTPSWLTHLFRDLQGR